MYRYLCVCSLIAFCASTAAQGAARELVAAKPTLVCPKTDLANEKLQSHYDTMWATYSTEGEKASEKLEAELEKQLKAAQSAGNLNLALFWQSAMTQYQQLGQLRWDDTDQRKRWKGRFGDAPFPAEFHVLVQKTCEDYSAAKEGLHTGYVELEKAFTMEGDFQRALAMRNEFAQLDALGCIGNPDPGGMKVYAPVGEEAFNDVETKEEAQARADPRQAA